MCGISGILTTNTKNSHKSVVEQMTDIIAHRGPDDSGVYENEFICLGHRRLSIIDLSSNGHQPMSNEDGSLTIVFNGEIFNYIELREQLNGKYHYKSDSDTEVILCYYKEYGVDCLKYFNGMFAFAIWDNNKNTLFCARDRFGQKPFYYYQTENEFIFSSEIKSILKYPKLDREFNPNAIKEYLYYALQDHTRETFFKNIYQLEQGHYGVISVSESNIKSNFISYYDLDLKSNEPTNPIEEFNKLLKDSVKLRLRSDVPIGVLLSGGLDSAAITQKVFELVGSNAGIKLFTAASYEKDIDESPFAKIIAKYFGYKHQIVYPEGVNLINDLKTLSYFHEKPIPGTSVFSHYQIMKKIQKLNVKVILQGQGSDEILAGYDNFYNSYLAELLRKGKFFEYLDKLNVCSKKEGIPYIKLLVSSLNKFIFKPYSIKPKFNIELLKKASLLKTNSKFKLKKVTENIFLNELYNYIKLSNLPYILHYEDRNSMIFSIESRTPFLDYRLVNYCFNLSTAYKINNGERKFVLKKAMEDKLPNEIIYRKKRGFPTPTRKWLAQDSNAEILTIFNSDTFKQNPFFDQKKTIEAYKSYCNGAFELEQDIWKILAVDTWYNSFFTNQ